MNCINHDGGNLPRQVEGSVFHDREVPRQPTEFRKGSQWCSTGGHLTDKLIVIISIKNLNLWCVMLAVSHVVLLYGGTVDNEHEEQDKTALFIISNSL